MPEIIKPGSTGVTVYLAAVQSSTGGVPGEPVTSLTNASILSASYVRTRGLRVAITTSALGTVNAAYSSGGFIEVDATNMPGLYRFDLPDAALATGVDQAHVQIKFTAGSNALAAPLSFDLASAAASFNAEVVDALSTDIISELAQATPPANPTLTQAVMLMYMALRNKLTTTASALKIHNDAGVAITDSTLADNGVTFTRSEMVSGP